MKIKDRLAFYFTIISILILGVALGIIFITFTSFVKADFYDRLRSRASIAAKLYLEADEITPDSLSHVRNRFQSPLTGEVVRFYDDKNMASFIRDRQQYWPIDLIKQVRRQKDMEFTEGDRQTVGIYYNDNQGNFVILVSARDTQGTQKIGDLIKIMSFMLICASIGLFFSGRWFAKKSLEPIESIISQMQLVRASNLSMRIDEGNGRDEISLLAQNFNRLLKHLENAFEVQQTFVTNASHELKTPVTSIIGEIEVSLNKQRTTNEYERTLLSVLNDAERLNETIAGLMELAQVDMNYTQAVLSPVQVDELIWELNDNWAARMGRNMFQVNIAQLPDDPDKLIIPANRALLMIALNNIAGNAFKFSKNQPVTCTLRADNSAISITITDCGIGIPPGEAEKVFLSFYRAANVQQYHGNGIGLYVTNKIISLFNGTISVDSMPGRGTSITVQFAVK